MAIAASVVVFPLGGPHIQEIYPIEWGYEAFTFQFSVQGAIFGSSFVFSRFIWPL